MVLKSASMRIATAALSAAMLLSSAAPSFAAVQRDAKHNGSTAKNVIVMISDGMGYNQMQAADYYLNGPGRTSFGDMPYKMAMSTYSYYGGYDPLAAWSDFDYVKSGATDSAAAATAMSTGVKTYDSAICVGVDGQPLTNLMEHAEDLGKATGVVTTVEWTHATPAGFVAHNASRNDYEGIGIEMIDLSATDVIMGAGNPWFDADGEAKTTPNTFKYVGGTATWDALVAGTAGADADGDGNDDPWTLIQTRSEFQDLMEGETPDRVCGTAQVYQTTQQGRSGDAYADPFEVPLTDTVPTLSEMTRGALNVLDNDEDGFVLMVEGGAVDWAGHANQSGRLIEEQIDFIDAVDAVNDWVRENSNWGETVLIVTADHETGYLTGPGSGATVTGPVWNPLAYNGIGIVPGMQWNSGDHTNSLIPLFAKGSAARTLNGYADQKDPVRGAYVDNTELAAALFEALD